MIALGIVTITAGTYWLSLANLGVAESNLIWPRVLQVMGLGMTTVPLSTIMFRFLPAEQNSNAAGIYALVRNEGGSIGIALSSTFLQRAQQTHQTYLGGQPDREQLGGDERGALGSGCTGRISAFDWAGCIACGYGHAIWADAAPSHAAGLYGPVPDFCVCTDYATPDGVAVEAAAPDCGQDRAGSALRTARVRVRGAAVPNSSAAPSVQSRGGLASANAVLLVRPNEFAPEGSRRSNAHVQLKWLPPREDWDERLRDAKGLPLAEVAARLRELATSQMEFSQLGKLDRALARALEGAEDRRLPGLEAVRLAILGSATTSHLPPAIRVAGLRRGLAIEVYEASYGMYWQELMDEGSGLYGFRPEVVLLALDARHLAANERATAEAALELMKACWRKAKASFACQVIQQTVMPVMPELMGSNESRMPGSPAAIVAEINGRLGKPAAEEGVDLLALDRMVLAEGLSAWHEPGMWYRSKHEVHPRAAMMYGDHVARLVAAGRGRSAKCLVLDLDNTLWGGVIGDDGLHGIVLGQGSGIGEAYAEFQHYARRLTERGVILAVCSKNDEKNALEPFEKHPEMVLKRDLIACFVANWKDKAANLRTIAKTLNIGLDSLVFADDNPAERAIIRQELPMVHVPEMPEDPAEYVTTLAAAGYFEGLRLTEEDRARAEQYQANAERELLKESATDIRSYLQSLRMVMTAGPFDAMNLGRVTQLVNKTNQFNLMTERLNEAEVAARMKDERWITLQARLADRFGDNGIIAVLMARVQDAEAVIETWLMSCRVLGRGVEEACLNLLAEAALAKGARRLVGLYRPTEKNGMVREMYGNLGFSKLGEAGDGATRWELDLSRFVPRPVMIESNVLREAAV